MIPYWPSDLPQRVLQDGFQASYASGRLSTPMEVGPPKMRRRISNGVRPLSAQIEVDEAGWARFHRFYGEETGGGTLPFLMPDQQRDGRAILAADGSSVLTSADTPLLITSHWLCLFGQEEPTDTPRGGLMWRISFSLLILPR